MPEKDDCTELQMELRDRWHSEVHGVPGGTRRYRWRPEVQMARGGADGAWLLVGGNNSLSSPNFFLKNLTGYS